MAKSTESGSGDWPKLAAAAEGDRTVQMAERFTEIHSLEEGVRADRMRSIIREETELSDDDMTELSKFRLLAWLSMDKTMAKQVVEDFKPPWIECPVGSP